MKLIQRNMQEHLELVEKLHHDEVLQNKICAVAADCVEVLKTGGRILLCGNGGSASDANHIACELSGRFYLNRPALPVISLATNTAHLTAVSNDFGYEQVFARGVEAFGSRGDILVGLSTSGTSKNVLAAFNEARQLEMSCVGMCGENTKSFDEVCDHVLSIPSGVVPRIQEMHILIGHIICEIIEKKLFGSDTNRS